MRISQRIKLITRCFSSPPSELTGTSRKKVTIETLRKIYKSNVPITMMTAHDYPTGYFCEKSNMDMTLVGDSLAMVSLGYSSTNPITLDEMLHHSRAVARGSKSPFMIGDMPFGTYESDETTAVKNSIRFMKEGQVEGVKLEGGVEMASTISKITKVGVPVLGHIGLTPQRAASLGGFKVQGRTVAKAKKLLEDALALEQAGCFMIILEAIPESVAALITSRLSIPTIGIGSGVQCSGQVLVQMDMLGVYDKLAPKFSKVYAEIGKQTISALEDYGTEVRNRTFPISGTHTYKMLKGEEEAFQEWIASEEARNQTTL
ncbi:ketopantoate hydroxymethyltransferase [Globomyces pollinis-pini]|nr:ketopantoate hydroxymethyltransferase [Globomyces pollinis-pini]